MRLHITCPILVTALSSKWMRRSAGIHVSYCFVYTLVGPWSRCSRLQSLIARGAMVRAAAQRSTPRCSWAWQVHASSSENSDRVCRSKPAALRRVASRRVASRRVTQRRSGSGTARCARAPEVRRILPSSAWLGGLACLRMWGSQMPTRPSPSPKFDNARVHAPIKHKHTYGWQIVLRKEANAFLE